MGSEMRARGASYSGAVCVNLVRHPAWGRAQESYGEDPIVLGSMGVALVLGIRENAMACVKHYALNSMEDMRFEVDVKVDEHALHEVYLPHFRRCLEEGGAESVMTAYNSVNGECAGENKVLLDEVLRVEWGLENVLATTDWVWGLRDGPKSVKAGLDVEMPWRAVRAKSLPNALAVGSLTWENVKKPAMRVLATQLAFHARIAGTPSPRLDVVGCREHRALARRVASEGMTLLKNGHDPAGQPLLPLSRETHRTIAVIGQLAASTQTGDQGSSHVRDRNVVSPLAGFQADPYVTTIHVDRSDIPAAIRAAQSSDVIFLLVGYTEADEGEAMLCSNLEINRQALPGWASYLKLHYALNLVGRVMHYLGLAKGGDRKSLRLRPEDERLVEAVVSAAGPKTILAIETGGAVILPEGARRKCAAILWTGYGGTEYGNAIQDVLWGRTEPSGRLPFIIPEIAEDLPDWSPSSTSVTYDRWHGYRLLQKRGKRAAYPFGYGLGYGDIRILPDTLTLSADVLADRFFEVSVDVEDRSGRAPDAVIQIYAGKTDPADRSEIDYERVLIGYSKTAVLPGQRSIVSVGCRLDPIAHRDSGTRRWELAKGTYTICAARFEGDPEGVARIVRVDKAVTW